MRKKNCIDQVSHIIYNLFTGNYQTPENMLSESSDHMPVLDKENTDESSSLHMLNEVSPPTPQDKRVHLNTIEGKHQVISH